MVELELQRGIDDLNVRTIRVLDQICDGDRTSETHAWEALISVLALHLKSIILLLELIDVAFVGSELEILFPLITIYRFDGLVQADRPVFQVVEVPRVRDVIIVAFEHLKVGKCLLTRQLVVLRHDFIH